MAASAIIWNLEGAGRGLNVLGDVTHRARSAYEHVQLAQAALAETDFTKSEAEFSTAEAELAEARTLLNNALASSGVVLRYLDVTGKLRSGQELLRAGEALTAAGQHASRGIGQLVTGNVFTTDKQGTTMVDALGRALEELTLTATLLDDSHTALQAVDVSTLPPDIAPHVLQLQESVPKARNALTGFLDQSQSILSVLGAERARQYLLLFENNHEIRPTGGFIGSIALLNIDRGVVENIDVQTVYDADGQLKEFIAPPEPLRAITDRWYMRDANWFVDFSTSAQKVAAFFEKEGGPTVDGVIAITPEVVRELLKVTGPIEVPAFNTTVDHENFVVLTQDQVTYSYDREVNRPKEFLAQLTPLLLSRLFAAPADSSLKVLAALGKEIHEKQLLIYFRDPLLQERIRRVGWDGAFPPAAPGFLSVNNANIGGHKTDQFMTQETDYRAEVARDGDVEVTVTVRRTHHGPEEKIDYTYPPAEDPAVKNNIVYQRVFVPKGAELLEATGFTPATDLPRPLPLDQLPELIPDPDVVEWQRHQETGDAGTTIGEEAGYSYFANWMITRPGGTSVGLYRYRLPRQAALPGLLNSAENFSMYIAKQPGEMRSSVRLEVHLPPGHEIVHTVPTDGVTQESPTTVVYRGPLTHDVLLGVVFARK